MVTKQDYIELAAFRAALRRFLRFAEEGARQAGLTPQQHQVLLAIKGQATRDWATVGELAEALQLKHHATVGLLDRCQEAGLLTRAGDPEDRRVVRVSLTEKGHAILERLTVRNIHELRALGKITAELETLTSSRSQDI